MFAATVFDDSLLRPVHAPWQQRVSSSDKPIFPIIGKFHGAPWLAAIDRSIGMDHVQRRPPRSDQIAQTCRVSRLGRSGQGLIHGFGHLCQQRWWKQFFAQHRGPAGRADCTRIIKRICITFLRQFQVIKNKCTCFSPVVVITELLDQLVGVELRIPSQFQLHPCEQWNPRSATILWIDPVNAAFMHVAGIFSEVEN